MAGATTTNVYITPTIITREAITQFKNQMVLASIVDRQHDKEFKKIGNSIDVRRPVKYVTTADNLDITSALDDTEEASRRLTLNRTETVPLAFDQDDLTLNVEDFSERYIKPAVISLVQAVETEIAGLYDEIYTFVGTAGTTPTTLAHLRDAKAALTRQATPFAMRHGVYESTAAGGIANAVPYTAGTSVPDDISGQALREATVARMAGFDLHESESIVRHTVGTWGSDAPLINNASPAADTYSTGLNQTVTSSIITDTWSNSTAVLNEGDVITIAGVNEVNPKTYQSTGNLQRFVVREDVTSDGSGNATFNVSPRIITSGPYQTVDAIYANNAAITVVSGTSATAYPQNLVFHRDAITLGMAPLQPPDNTLSATETMDGISMTYTRDGDALRYRTVHRLDILFGVLLQIPEYAARHTG